MVGFLIGEFATGWPLVLVVLVVMIGDFSHATDLQRVRLVAESFEMFTEHPVAGVGGWNFGLEYPSVSFDGRWQRHPHSLSLLVLAEWGLTGFLAVSGIVLTWLYKSRIPKSLYPVLAFLVVHEFVDTMVWIPGILYIMVLVVSLILVENREYPLPADENRSYPAVGFSILLIVLSVGGSFVQYNYRAGIEASQQGNWKSARQYWSRVNVGFTYAHAGVACDKIGNISCFYRYLQDASGYNSLDPYYPFMKYSRIKVSTSRRKKWKQRIKRLDPHHTQKLLVANSGDTRSIPEKLKPAKINRYPYEARWYLPLVKRSIRKKRPRQALRQIKILEEYPVLYHTTRVRLVESRLQCYRMLRKTGDVERWQRQLKKLKKHTPDVRPQFHRFFYRRVGMDHVLN
ncbi:MAG: O-antigen ligase family protein [bacterium]